MGYVIEEIVPAAISVVFVNPLPILAAILLVLSPRGGSTAPAFMVGWSIGIMAVLGLLLFAVPADPVVGNENEPSTLSSAVLVLLGFVLIFLAVRQWRRQPNPGEKSSIPAWMATLEKSTPIAALGLGATMSGVNPKNLAFNIAAIVAIAQAHLATNERLVAVALYVLLASAGVAAPVIWCLFDRERALEKLDGWKTRLTANYSLIMAIVMFLFGITLSSRGIGELIG